MSNRRKSNVLRLDGRKDRLRDEHEYEQAVNIEPPEWLASPEATAEWERVAPVLAAAMALKEADLSALGHLCNLHGSIIKKYRADLTPTGTELQQLRMFYADFGMTPAGRLKIAPMRGGDDDSGGGAGPGGGFANL